MGILTSHKLRPTKRVPAQFLPIHCEATSTQTHHHHPKHAPPERLTWAGAYFGGPPPSCSSKLSGKTTKHGAPSKNDTPSVCGGGPWTSFLFIGSCKTMTEAVQPKGAPKPQNGPILKSSKLGFLKRKTIQGAIVQFDWTAKPPKPPKTAGPSLQLTEL